MSAPARVTPPLLLAAAVLLGAVAARAEPPEVADDDGPTLGAAFLLAHPSAMETGLSAGLALSVATDGTFGVGAGASWSTATEYTRTWHVTQQELRLRAHGLLQRAIGRGRLALRLGLGGTEVYESRLRDQAARLGLTGDELETTAWVFLPAAELEAVVSLLVFDRFGVAVSAGPSAVLLGGELSPGFVSSLGVTWTP